MRLELFREDHLGAMAPLLADPDVLRFTLLPVPVPDDFLRAWYWRYEQGRRDEGMREDLEIWSRLPGDP